MKLVVTDADLEHGGNAQRLHLLRSAAYFLLHAAGDLDEKDEAAVPAGTTVPPTSPSLAPAARAPATGARSAAVSDVANTSLTAPNEPTGSAHASNVPPPPPPPPPPSSDAAYASSRADELSPRFDASGDAGDYDDETGESNVITGNFPQAGAVPPPPLPPPPPPPPANTATVPTPPSSVPSPPAADADTSTVPAGVDSAGMPYDARIHQKTGNKKKDGTWKLIKGIDPTVVQQVTAELAAKRGSLLAGSTNPVNTMPVPPVSNGAAASGVPAPPVPPSVPVPPPPAVGAVGSNSQDEFRKLVDRIIAYTKEGKLTPNKVSEICQLHGAPSLMQLNSMQHLIPDVSKGIDAAALGLM